MVGEGISYRISAEEHDRTEIGCGFLVMDEPTARKVAYKLQPIQRGLCDVSHMYVV
jgi:hypothetical protein